MKVFFEVGLETTLRSFYPSLSDGGRGNIFLIARVLCCLKSSCQLEFEIHHVVGRRMQGRHTAGQAKKNGQCIYKTSYPNDQLREGMYSNRDNKWRRKRPLYRWM